MIIALTENAGAVADRLAEIGRQGIYWKFHRSRSEIAWSLLTGQTFPGRAPLLALGTGIDPHRMNCALVRVKSGKLPTSFKSEEGEVLNAGKITLAVFHNEKSLIKRLKMRFGAEVEFFDGGKLKGIEKEMGTVVAESPEVKGVARALGMKLADVNRAIKEKGIKLIEIKGKAEKEFIPLIKQVEKENVLLVELTDRACGGIIAAGPHVDPDSRKKFYRESAGLGTMGIREMRYFAKFLAESEKDGNQKV